MMRSAMAMHPLQHLLDRPLPDLSFLSSQGGTFALRQFVGQRPLVLFFYIRNSTPG
jgi:peroxiredoxin